MKIVVIAAMAAAAGGAMGQSDVDPANKSSWQENCGWMNWRDAVGGSQGVRDRGSFLSGSIWCENLGWVRVGGTPANGVRFANVTGETAGVNVNAEGYLTGLAWGENVGWINFAGGGTATPPNPARIDPVTERLVGFVWGENIGWINLGSTVPGQFVKLICFANCDASTTPPVLNVQDFSCFLNQFAAGDPSANCDRSTTLPVLNVQDFSCFLNKFSAGCL